MSPLIVTVISVLLTAFISIIVAYARYVHNLKERVAVMERTIEDLQQTMERTTENIQQTIGNIQKRQDSHSKKQDDILDRIGSMEKEVLKQMGSMTANIATLASDLKGLSNLIAVSDLGVKVNRQ
ncbi:MAG: hypothetical protein J6M41_09140 [Prevotella sp.]|nr:hypothetical protein [Prevotella sp.]